MDHRSANFDLRRRRMHAGFSFTEVLFAVMILAIGFIMIAAIFPVAIKQTAQSSEEATGASVGQGAASYISKVANASNMPVTVPGFTANSAGVLVPPVPLTPPPPPPGNSGPQTYGQVWSFRDDRMVFSVSGPMLLGPLMTNFSAYSAADRDKIWQVLSGNQILPSDNRYAYVAMYKRDMYWSQDSAGNWFPQPSPFAELIIITTQIRNRSAYSPADLIRQPPSNTPQMPSPEPAVLEPKLVGATLWPANPDTGFPSHIQFTFPNAAAASRAVPGAYVVVSDDNLTSGGVRFGHYNGRIFRLGNPRPDLPGNSPSTPSFEFAAGAGMDLAAGDVDKLVNAKVFLVGAGYADPTNPNAGCSGAAQDISVYTTFVQVQ